MYTFSQCLDEVYGKYYYSVVLCNIVKRLLPSSPVCIIYAFIHSLTAASLTVCFYDREVDRDGDGRVSYRDFEFMMKYRSQDSF